MTSAVGGRSSQVAALVPLAPANSKANTSQVAVLTTWAPPGGKYTRTSQVAALVPLAPANSTANTSQIAMLVVWGEGVPVNYVRRSWTFTFDGHTFYVLQLGTQGTWLYDTSTQEWSQWDTAGYGFWNMLSGCTWGYRVVAGSSASIDVWELDPAALLDEGFRDIDHTVTGILDVRSRKYYSCAAVRITASAGLLDEVNGATMTFTFSDDQGQTWSPGFVVNLTEANTTQEVAWRAMGSFAAPGRVFQFSDVGGLLRIDGADAAIDNFDEDGGMPAPQQGGQR